MGGGDRQGLTREQHGSAAQVLDELDDVLDDGGRVFGVDEIDHGDGVRKYADPPRRPDDLGGHRPRADQDSRSLQEGQRPFDAVAGAVDHDDGRGGLDLRPRPLHPTLGGRAADGRSAASEQCVDHVAREVERTPQRRRRSRDHLQHAATGQAPAGSEALCECRHPNGFTPEHGDEEPFGRQGLVNVVLEEAVDGLVARLDMAGESDQHRLELDVLEHEAVGEPA